jgi:hypothetical protein
LRMKVKGEIFLMVGWVVVVGGGDVMVLVMVVVLVGVGIGLIGMEFQLSFF